MSNDALKLLQKAALDQQAIANRIAPALDDILLFSLERRYLGVGRFKDLYLEQSRLLEKEDLPGRLRKRVRLVQVDEICYERDARFHLSGVESILSSMRESGHSLIFLVSGESDRARIYLGLSQFFEEPLLGVDEAIRGYEATWRAHFPGAVIRSVSESGAREVSASIGMAKHCGFLTGLPSLKREEAQEFVQGLERLIRALRGRTYHWLSIADPIESGQIDSAIESCRRMTGDVHQLVKTSLTKGVSSGKTVMAGLFGMAGCSDTEGKAYSVTESKSDSHTEGTAQQHLEAHQRVARGLPAGGMILGSIIGSIVPGVGTAIGGVVGGAVGTLLGSMTGSIGDAITGKSGHSTSISDTVTTTRAFTNTTSQAIAHQLSGGGFGSFGMSWTRTTSITQELLNRKAEYCEELLRKHEERLLSGRVSGMWTVGHYFCSEDAATYEMGNGVVRSLFSGMDSQYEPPRVTGLPVEASTLIRRFANIYLSFPNDQLKQLLPGGAPPGYLVASHPLGYVFNGVGTPLTTEELAVATPLPVQEAEGITVSRRAEFGVNAPVDDSGPSLTLGDVLDHGDLTRQKIRIQLDNLPKHLGVFGLTGSGKTTTVKQLLVQLWEKHRIPFLVIEPAKSEYRQLAAVPSLAEDLVIFSAGVESPAVSPLRLNPFEFAATKSGSDNGIHLLTHVDRLKAVFNATFPMYASMPYLLEEALLEIYRDNGWDLTRSRNRYCSLDDPGIHEYFPNLQDLHGKIESVVKKKGYWVEQEQNLKAALKTRIASLMTGSKGSMLNCARSIPDASLFGKPAVIELRHLGDDDEKAFLMGLLVSKLYEYRESQGSSGQGRPPLKHLLVIEEAHRLLADVPESGGGLESTNMRGKGVSTFIDMLSEIRAYGQGVVVVDQVPSRLHPYIVKGTATKVAHRLLARDDREMVGNTMGLEDGQMRDMGLLNQGECIFHQDGFRKAFLCRVSLSKSMGAGAVSFPNSGTRKFRDLHREILGDAPSAGSQVGREEVELADDDIAFHDDLAKAMMAGVFADATQISVALQAVLPEALAAKASPPGKGSRLGHLRAYWIQIVAEIRSYYGGDYSRLLAFRRAGLALFRAWATEKITAKEAGSYRVAAEAFFASTRLFTTRSKRSLVACAYDQLFVRTEALVAIAQSARIAKPAPDQSASRVISESILRQIRVLLPQSPFMPPRTLVVSLAEAIAGRITDEPQQQAMLCKIVAESLGGGKP